MIFKDTRKLLIMITVLVLFSVIGVLTENKQAAATETENSITITDASLFETAYVDGIYTITRFKGQNITTITVPAAINGQTVRAIGASAFNGCGNIQNLYLPDTLEVISGEAFSACPIDNIGSYTYRATGEFSTVNSADAEEPFTETPTVESGSVTTASSLPTHLTQIGHHAFYNSSIKNIIINSQNLIIGKNAFENTGNLLDVTITASAHIIEIGEMAFLNSGIHRFLINGSIGKVGDQAFRGTANITEFTVNEGGNINELGASVFETSGVHSVTLRGTVTSIGDRAFASCGNILNVTVDSSTPYTIGQYAFNNAGIQRVDFSKGLSIVEKGTFEGCANLEVVHLPDTLTHIEEDAFKNLPNLKEITINENVVLAPNAFAGASGSTLGALASTNNASAKALAGVTSTPEPEPVVTTPVLSIAPPPTVPPVTTVKVSAVKLKKAKVNKKKKKVTLTWSKNKKASGYTIYKKVVKKGTKAKKAKKIKFVKVKNVNKKTLKLTLKLAKKSTTWFYVKAFVKTKTGGKTVTTYSKASNTKKVVVK